MSAVRYILYVDPVDTGSVKALKSAAQARCGIYECDVKRLTARPEWLDGVPSLLDRSQAVLYKGSRCLKELEALSVL